jgi:hypothetical protein
VIHSISCAPSCLNCLVSHTSSNRSTNSDFLPTDGSSGSESSRHNAGPRSSQAKSCHNLDRRTMASNIIASLAEDKIRQRPLVFQSSREKHCPLREAKLQCRPQHLQGCWDGPSRHAASFLPVASLCFVACRCSATSVDSELFPKYSLIR